jgi:NAD dependent epimerase/dehydratase family enzyme
LQLKTSTRGLFILGATGFIGKHVVKEAVEKGFGVKALVRTAEKAAELAEMGAEVISGDAKRPEEWMPAVAGYTMLIDLVQPEIPGKIGLAEVQAMASYRKGITERLCAALQRLPLEDRPLLVSVSGLDDLAPDSLRSVDDSSPLRQQFTGFSHIGIPVRRTIERMGVKSSFAYLGTVYGPGKAFAKTIFPQIAAGRFRIPGSGNNRMPLVHVDDAARALVHLALLGPARLEGHSFVIADGSHATMREFLGSAAEFMHAPKPRTVPKRLAQLAVGEVLCQALTRDIAAVPAALVDSGFVFRYPSYREGLPPTLRTLGYGDRPNAAKPVHSKEESSGRFWVLFVLAFSALIIENSFNFPLSVPWMKHLAQGAPILDTRPGYSAAGAYALFDVLGDAGRSAYLKLLWTIDLVLPMLFGLFLSVAIQRGAFRRLKWIPLAGTGLDYAENIAITILLTEYPTHHPGLVRIASALTLLKLAGYGSGMLLAVGGGIVRAVSGRSGSSRDRKLA